MQKSVEGLLRSVLHSILIGLLGCERSKLDVIKYICGSRWRSTTTNCTWNRKDLKDMLTRVGSVSTMKNFILIDALDECEPQDRLSDLADEILWMSQLPNVKLCVSCRPWDVFARRFDAVMLLRLEELTYGDMENYIEARLTVVEEERDWNSDFRNRTRAARRLVRDVARSSEGVFLWTELVVTAMCCEMRKGSRVEQLSQMMSDFPADLDAYFHQLVFNRILKFSAECQGHCYCVETCFGHSRIKTDERYCFSSGTSVRGLLREFLASEQ